MGTAFWNGQDIRLILRWLMSNSCFLPTLVIWVECIDLFVSLKTEKRKGIEHDLERF
jgi:hypothetical protein